MNTRIFALLLLVPLAIFGTDRLLSSETSEGGGKEKKTTTTTATTATTETEAVVEEAQTDETVQPVKTAVQTQQQSVAVTETGTTTPKKSMTATIKASLEDLSVAYYDDQGEDRMLWLGDEKVGQKTADWLKENVLEPLKKANPMTINVGRSFSRCPSGYHINVIVEDGVATTQGWLIGDDGCSPEPIGKFKYDVEAGIVQVFVGTSDVLVDMERYFELYKAAKA